MPTWYEKGRTDQLLADKQNSATLDADVESLAADTGSTLGTRLNSTFVRTVNGTSPDATGNVSVSGTGAVDSVNGQTGAVVLDAADVGAAPTLAADDNYVTDAEKVKLANLSGTNTGDQVLPTWSTISGKPAVVAAGATQADARTAIGAGMSSFSGAYADLTGKPTLGTAAATDSTAYATAAQGALADTALQATTAQAINAQTGTTYTLVAADAGKLVTLNNAAAITLTVPASVFTAGQRVDFLVLGAGMVTVVGSGTTVNGTPSLVSRAQYSAASVMCVAADTFVVVGDLA